MKMIEWNGKTITKAGLYSKIPLDLYHAPNICDGPSASSSMLRKMNPDVGSMAHFHATWCGNPEAKTPEDARHFVVGRAVHHLLLGEPFFAKLFCVQPDEYPEKKSGELKKWNNNAGHCRDWAAARRKEGRSILTSKEVEAIKGMSIAVGRHPLARHFLGGQIERSFFWRDEETGIWLKWRPDAMPDDDLNFGDLKTTQSTMYFDLMRTVRDYAYYQQAALGREACRRVLKEEMQSYTFLFVEKTLPFWPRDVRVDDLDLDRGHRMNRACLRNFAACLKSGQWPGPGSGNEGNDRIRLSEDARLSIDKTLKAEGLGDGED